jgi:predicted component of type VI protein secretion system
MAKLVLLSAGMTGRTHELTVDKTTIGRVEDNTFQIAEASVSSHHCEILLRGTDVIVKDLNSTNGTFISGEKVSETVLKPGQILRLGQIEMRLETAGGPPSPAAPGAAAAPAPAPSGALAAPVSNAAAAAPASKRALDQTMVMQRGVKLDEVGQGMRPAFDTSGSGFSKKDNKVNKIVWIVAGALGLVIICLLLYVFAIAGK